MPKILTALAVLAVLVVGVASVAHASNVYYSNRTVTRVPTASQSSATRQRQLAGCCRPLRMARTGAGRSWLHDADFHGAWRAPDGQLLDITPRRDDEDRVLFLTEPSSRQNLSPRSMWPP